MDDHQVDSTVVVQVSRGDPSADHRAREVGGGLGARQLEATSVTTQE
jgi:hypothetical protein